MASSGEHSTRFTWPL